MSITLTAEASVEIVRLVAASDREGRHATLLGMAVGGVAVSLLSTVSALGQGAQQPQARIETVYPRHVARGRTTVINVAIPSWDTVQGR